MLTSMPKTPEYPQYDLAGRLRSALEESGVTQAQLARACGVTDQAVHDWLKTGRIGKTHLPTICALTGKSFEYFLVGLKTWRRVAALALPFMFLAATVVNVAGMVGCVLCKIERMPIFAMRNKGKYSTV